MIFEAKYIKGKSEYIAPAKLDKNLTKAIQLAAVRIYNLIGCYGLARVDFILEDDKFYFLEVNSLPGMTQLSLAPMAASVDGIAFDDLVKKIIGLSFGSLGADLDKLKVKAVIFDLGSTLIEYESIPWPQLLSKA